MPDTRAGELPTKNAARTSAHLAKIEQRRVELRHQIAKSTGQFRRTVLEVGCGHGHFLTAFASQHADALCFGVDIASDRITRAEKKRVRAKLPNLHFIHTDARLFIEELPSNFSLSEIYVLFPDPWPKQRHHKNRIVQPPFLDLLNQRSAPNARLYFRTDYQPYFADAAAVFRESASWEIVEEPWPFEHETVFQARAPAFASLVARVRSASVPRS